MMTASSRVVRETKVEGPSWPGDRVVQLGLNDALGAPLANGSYHFVAEAVENDGVADLRTGTFFVLR